MLALFEHPHGVEFESGYTEIVEAAGCVLVLMVEIQPGVVSNVLLLVRGNPEALDILESEMALGCKTEWRSKRATKTVFAE